MTEFENENYQTFEQYKNEKKVLIVGKEAIFSADGLELLEPEIKEVLELVRPYIPKDNYFLYSNTPRQGHFGRRSVVRNYDNYKKQKRKITDSLFTLNFNLNTVRDRSILLSCTSSNIFLF